MLMLYYLLNNPYNDLRYPFNGNIIIKAIFKTANLTEVLDKKKTKNVQMRQNNVTVFCWTKPLNKFFNN